MFGLNQQFPAESEPIKHKYIPTLIPLVFFAFFKQMVCQKQKELRTEVGFHRHDATSCLPCSAARPFLLCICVKGLKDDILKSKAMLQEKCIS